MEENRGSVSACICDTGSWNVCRKAGTWSFIGGRVEYLSYHHTAKRKSFHWACAVYNVGFPGFVPGDFPKGERGVDGISGSSVCFPCISAYFQPDRLPV